MVRTQVQLPDELYHRAKRFAARREISLAEVARRGLEQLLDRYPAEEPEDQPWRLPRVDGGKVQVPLEELRSVAAADQEARGQKP